MLFGDYFNDSIFVAAANNPLNPENYHGVIYFIFHGLIQPPVWLAAAGVGLAYFLYIKRPELPAIIAERSGILYKILVEKYYFDRFNDWFFAGGTRKIGNFMWQFGDVKFIDGFINGMADLIDWVAGVARKIQTGFLYHYAFLMIIGLAVMLGTFVYM